MEQRNTDWTSELPPVVRKYNQTNQNPTIFKPIDASKKSELKISLLISPRQEKKTLISFPIK